ncbi:MAG TPA: hypothetical protein VHU92_12115, partial [Streptosporangiaceae bacterium]|nr:hypothetical protein [Streptosporangiaceae bacterium]
MRPGSASRLSRPWGKPIRNKSARRTAARGAGRRPASRNAAALAAIARPGGRGLAASSLATGLGRGPAAQLRCATQARLAARLAGRLGRRAGIQPGQTRRRSPTRAGATLARLTALAGG